MEIKEMINKLQEHFIGKMLDGDFKVIDVNKYKVTVDIDNYRFYFWIANGEKFFRVYVTDGNFMDLSMKEDERPLVYKAIMDKAKSFYNEMYREEKIKMIKDLKDELDMMENY